MLWELVPFLLLTWNFTVPQTPVRVTPWGTRLLYSIFSNPIQYWQVTSCCMMSWLKMHWKLTPNNHLTRPICLLLFCRYPCNFQWFPLINCLYHMILLVFIGEMNIELGPLLVAHQLITPVKHFIFNISSCCVDLNYDPCDVIVGNVHPVELYFIIDILKQHHNRCPRYSHNYHLLILLPEHIHIDNIVPLMQVVVVWIPRTPIVVLFKNIYDEI